MRTPDTAIATRGTDVLDPLTPDQAAACAGLKYVSDREPGIRRRRSGRSFAYLLPGGSRVTEPRHLRRIRSLAIPPAWTDVWICGLDNGHLQATGRDARGRKQYLYHPGFRAARDSTKFQHVVAFASALPRIRARVRKDMASPGLSRERVLATVVHLLEATLIRVGNEEYTQQNGSYGLTTLKNRHVAVDGGEVRFCFVGKSGRHWSVSIRDRRVARIIRACQDLPGQELLQYLDADGARQQVRSDDVNDYLRAISGQDITAKDFRTWAATVAAALALHGLAPFRSMTEAKRNVRAAIAGVAERLGNTVTICRTCYVHPRVLEAYLDRTLVLAPGRGTSATGLRPDEKAVLAFLRKAASDEPRPTLRAQLVASTRAARRNGRRMPSRRTRIAARRSAA